MNILGSFFLAGIVLVAIIVYYIQPWRTVANFCSTYATGKNQLIQQWSQNEHAGTDSFSKLLYGFSNVASQPTDLANFFGKLDQDAPSEIEPDIATIRDAFKKESDMVLNVNSSNVLQGLVPGLMLGFSTQGAYSRVNSYLVKNCNAK